MSKSAAVIGLGLITFACCIPAAFAASDPCVDCGATAGAAPELSIREQIKADRAREVDRIAKESADRPWDGKDLGQIKRTSTAPVVR
jgi:hypothetical protein